MKKKTLRHLFFISAIIFAVCCVQPVFAHGTEPRLEISVERINPGGIVEVRGVDFDYEELVELSLMRSEIQIPLIEITADGEGVFTQIVALPADLPVGDYNFQARSDHHLVTSPTIMVWGTAVLDQEDSAIREQSDVQFGVIPTFAPTTVPEAVYQPVAEHETSNLPPVQNSATLFMLTSLVIVAFLVLTGVRMIRKR